MKEITELEPRRPTAEYDASRVKVEKPSRISASGIERPFALSPVPSGERDGRLRNFVHILIYAPQKIWNNLVPGARGQDVGDAAISKLVPEAVKDGVVRERLLFPVQQMNARVFCCLDRRHGGILLQVSQPTFYSQERPSRWALRHPPIDVRFCELRFSFPSFCRCEEHDFLDCLS